MQFAVRKNHLCCTVSSRSTDIYTGLPYDMGFFSFVTELVYKDLLSKLPEDVASKIKLGPVTMKSNFTQIYDKSRDAALKLLAEHEKSEKSYLCDMPAIGSAQATLKDIYENTAKTPVMEWIQKNAQ